MANGNGYSAGNLEFAVQKISDSALSSLDKLIAKLKTTMNLLGSVSSLTKGLGTTVGRKSSSGASFNNNSTKQNLTGQKELVKIVEEMSEGTKEIANNVKKMNAFSITSILNKVYFLRNYTKQMFQNITGMLSKAVEYTETLNLWQVAMRNNRKEAEDFVETMNKAYGISTQTLMNYQAIFRNMLSSLGGISENTSYALSEFLTQMAIDYASLYNTSIEKAMTTFQSVLSGQVRPIRSIAGYDITETTIYQLYQQLGGTKTMRQLTQTEKRLLRIYAVFQQMESSGAIGDLNRTLGNTANQMRILSESTKELMTWFGLIIEDIVKPYLPYLNAFVITLTNIVKAIANMRGVELFESGLVDNVEDINEAIDEMTGKLLGFDKFSALNTSEESNILGIDENLLSGLSKYTSLLSQVSGEAQKIAESWTKFWVNEETGELTEQAQNLVDVVSALSISIGSLIAFNLIGKIGKLVKSITGLTTATKALNFVVLTGAVYAIIKAVEAFKEGDTFGGILALTIGVTLVGAYVALRIAKLKSAQATQLSMQATAQESLELTKQSYIVQQTAYSWKTLGISIGAFTIALGAGLAILQLVPEEGRKTAGIIMTIVGAVVALTAALVAMFTTVSWGTMLPVLMAGVGVAIAGASGWAGQLESTANSVQVRKNGGMIEDGLFTMNKGEIMGTFDDGTSIVANNQQIISGIEQGVYKAVRSAMNNSGSGDVILKIDSKELARATVNANANALSKNYRVDFQPR